MDAQRWQAIQAIFEEVLECGPEARVVVLERACAGDPALRAEVEKLLHYNENVQGQKFLSPLPLSVKSQMPTSGSPDSLIGQTLGHYRIKKRLGGGGMGNVYLAVRISDYQQLVAIKVLRQGMDTKEILKRFRSEIQVLAVLGKHPNIARLLDAGNTEEGSPYFVMEYVEGEFLDHYCNQRNLDLTERIHIFRAVCSAVHFAHQHMIIHRDLKMSNVLVQPDGVPKLIDFGIAKLVAPELGFQTADPTVTAFQILTPGYASPEQVRGDSLTTASDVYSLGVVLYELLTGHKPRKPGDLHRTETAGYPDNEPDPQTPSKVVTQAASVTLSDGRVIELTAEQISKARATTPRRLQRLLGGDLDYIVLKAMRKEPHYRYSGADYLSDDLLSYLENRPVTARPLGKAQQLIRWCQRNPLPSGLFLTVLFTLAAGLWHLSHLSAQLVQTTALQGAALEADILQQVQDFYSKVVVDSIKDEVPVTHRYAVIEGAIPVPASFTIDLGEHIRKSQTTAMFVRLYSDYPFRYRNDGGPQDEFEQLALAHLRENEGKPFYRFESYEGRKSLRYATARVMEASCVACHNSHEDSTKTDWKEGDVRGVLEVIRPLDQDILRTQTSLRDTFFYMLALSVLLVVLAVASLKLGNQRKL
ncbi:MAG: protein kinase [Acidiferrobacterales bacterium]